MKVKMTLAEVCNKFRDLDEQRAIYARCLAETILEDESQNTQNAFANKFKKMDDRIKFLSSIVVEFDDGLENLEGDK